MQFGVHPLGTYNSPDEPARSMVALKDLTKAYQDVGHAVYVWEGYGKITSWRASKLGERGGSI